MEDVWLEEPLNEEFEHENKNEDEDEDITHKTKALVKQVSRRLSMAVIVKWLSNHSKEPHRQIEIAEGVKLNQGTVSFNLNRLANVGVVKIIRLEGLDRHPLYQVNPDIGKLISRRYLWLCSWKLLKTLPKKDTIRLDELRFNSEFLKVMQKHRLTFEEAVEALSSNKFVEVVFDREGKPYCIKLKEMPTVTIPHKQVEVSKEREVEEIG